MALVRLIYFSENQIDPGAGSIVRALSRILGASNRNNRSAGLTGALVFDDMWFVQVLEGERTAVWQTFERIREDERHDGVTIAEFVDIEKRLFGNWWMGLARRSGTTEAVFQHYLKDGKLDPPVMTAAQMLALMIDLSKSGFRRVLAAGENSPGAPGMREVGRNVEELTSAPDRYCALKS